MGFSLHEFKISYIAFHVHYNCIFMHLVVCYTCWTACVLLGLDWAEPMMFFFFFTLHVTCLCIFMHTFFTFNIFLYIVELFGAFLIVSFFPLSLSFTLVVSVAPKRKSTPSQNPLRSEASSSSDPTSSHIRFRDEDAQKDFSENFSYEVFIRNAESFW